MKMNRLSSPKVKILVKSPSFHQKMNLWKPSIGKLATTNSLSDKPLGLVYFLHGACDSGNGLKSWVHKVIDGTFAFKDFPVVYPTSPKRPYTLHDGNNETIWFDQLTMSPNSPEDLGSISNVGSQLSKLIKEGQKESGIPSENIILGGYAMGGAMAMHVGYRMMPNIAGVFAISSFLPPDSRIYEDLVMTTSMNTPPVKFDKNKQPIEPDPSSLVKFPKLFMSHGLRDPIVPYKWGKSTFHELRHKGVDGQFYTMGNIEHTISKPQLGLLHTWICDTLYSKTPKTQEKAT